MNMFKDCFAIYNLYGGASPGRKQAGFSLDAWTPDSDGKEHPEHLLCQRGESAWHHRGLQRDSWEAEAL